MNQSMFKSGMAMSLLLVFFLGMAGCGDVETTINVELEEDEIAIELKGTVDSAQVAKYLEQLEPLADGDESNLMSSSSTFGSSALLTVGPVKDIEAFSKKIPFGKVVSVDKETKRIVVSIE